MQKVKLGLLIILVALLAACNVVPPTMVVMMITNTPDPRVVAITVTPAVGTSQVTAQATASQAATAQATTAQAPLSGGNSTGPASTPTAVVIPATNPPPPSSTFGPTPTLSPFPTEVRTQIHIAQEDFQHGRMIWIEQLKQIWVMYNDPPDNFDKGEWQAYQDTFVDGEPEIDPTLTPPQANLYQPKRGFGKLWRTTPGMRDALGWATTPEFALTTTYVYQAGGYLDANNQYVRQPGTHFITNLSRQTFALHEGDQPNIRAKWERVS